jgi:hypothetical protein
LQDKLEISNKELKESSKELRESNDKSQRDIEIKFEKLQENMKADLKTESEKLILRIDGKSKTGQTANRKVRF